MNSKFRRLILAVLLLLTFSQSSEAQMWVNVDGYFIGDNFPGDLDLTVNRISFDSLAVTPNGFTTTSGFDAKGVVELSSVAGALAAQLNSGQALVLTNFVADMPASASSGAFTIVFEHNYNFTIPGGGTAADTLVAFANDGTGSPPYLNGGGAVPLAVGEDLIIAWQGYVDNVAIPTPSTPVPPLFNLAGLNTPYTVFGHATTAPLFGGIVFNAILRGDLTFALGGSRNQFVLLTSAEVGLEELPDIASVPLLPTSGVVALAAAIVGSASLLLLRRRFA